jgi:two-component system sensor histidine kinase EvgS
VTGILVGCNNTPILNETEKDWLKQHDNLIVGISPNAPPYQFVNDQGEICGIFIDFLSIIESRLNYKFRKVYESDFSKLLASTKDGTVDLLLEVQKTDERLQYLNFTPLLTSHNHVIVVRKSQQGISTVDDLKDKEIAVVSKYAVQEYLTQNYPDFNLLPLIDDVNCLRAVSTGHVDAFICQQAVATYYIENEGISNLKISGEIKYKNDLAIASRKDLDVLNAILLKAVNSISKNEKQKVYNNWLSYTVKPYYLEPRFWLAIVFTILLVLAFVSLFNIVLQKRVKTRTIELNIASEKARESDRLKSAFLANMSHEIRTPMNGILGFAELLKEPGLTGEEQQKYIAIIGKSGERMLNIINNIIDISKIEAGQVIMNIQDTDLHAMSDFLFNFFKPEMEKKGLAFYCNVPPENDHRIIKTDKEKLYAILTNLLKNAIKYTPKGTIEFGYNVVGTTGRLPQQTGLSTIQFYVKDTGIGIPKDRQHAIFDRFVQADIEDTKAMQGAGIGLAISKAYAGLLGGNIRVESQHQQGSTFWLTIPLKNGADNKPASGVADNPVKKSPPLHNDLTILIAEDEASSDLFLTKILTTECKQIVHAATGTEAVDACRKNPAIGLVLMDIKMPLMNGYEATRIIRSFNKNVVIIAQTAYALSGDREKALAAGCNDYIAKPIKVNELRMLLAKHMNNEQHVKDEK